MLWWRNLIDLFLPRSSELRMLEELSVADFYHRAEKSVQRKQETVLAIFSYKDPLVRAAIWQIKYRNHRKVSRLLAEILYSELVAELEDLSQFSHFVSPILIPIPLSAARQKARGYNQTENLAKEMMRLDRNNIFTLEIKVLVKTKDTPPQSSLPRSSRLQNLRGSFQVKNSEKIRGRNIILIDDVTTTGATLKEASATLRRAGARKVIAIVVAH